MTPVPPAVQGGDQVRSVREQRAEQPLYVNRIKVYPRKVEGLFRRIKWLILGLCLAAYYVMPWIRWDRGPNAPNQALLLDMPGRRGYFFWIEIWPQEVYFLTGLLILGAVALFLVTSYLGRVWCGYTCPQTVWTDLFMLVERWIEGDRNARIKLDKAGWDFDKAWRKIAKHAAWIAIGAATGGAWVFYFVDAPTTFVDIFTGRASFTVYLFIALFAASTYTLAGWAREQVCTYMCPWPRFQAAMFDENTLTVTYRGWRGEPRGKHKAGTSWEGRGDCIDCGSCVAVCPTGIDIRDGQQLECIGCGLCIDACDAVMKKIDRPLKLIAFDTLAHVQAASSTAPYRLSWIRPRPMIYAGVLAIVASVMIAALVMRGDTELHVLRDRAPLFVTLSDGTIRNGYTIKILNKARETRNYTLAVRGLTNTRVTIAGEEGGAATDTVTLVSRPDSIATYRVYVAAAATKQESVGIDFLLQATSQRSPTTQHSTFVGPKR